MRNKGIILAGLIYALLIFFLMLLVSILLVLWHRQNAIDYLKKEANKIFNLDNMGFVCGGEYIDERDGNRYKTIQVGELCWFAEDLRYIGNDCLSNLWVDNTTSCDVHNTDWGEVVLYQWDAAMNNEMAESSQGVCPPGWYVPSDNDFLNLEESLGMSQEQLEGVGFFRGTDEGYRLKAENPYWDGNDRLGFTALPNDIRDENGDLNSSLTDKINFEAWWTSSLFDEDNGWLRLLSSEEDKIKRSYENKSIGLSVRCVTGNFEEGTLLADVIGNELTEKNNSNYYVGSDPANYIMFGTAFLGDADEEDDRLSLPKNAGLIWRIIKSDDNGIKLALEHAFYKEILPYQEETDFTSAFDMKLCFFPPCPNPYLFNVPWSASGSNKWMNSSVKGFLDSIINDLFYSQGLFVFSMNITPYFASVKWCVNSLYDPDNLLGQECEDQLGFPGGDFPGQLDAASIASIISVLDYMSASDDANCISPFDQACSNKNYLYLSNYNYWTVNAYSGDSNSVAMIKKDGSLDLKNAALDFVDNVPIMLRPVIMLKKNVIYQGGNGTLKDPFVVHLPDLSFDWQEFYDEYVGGE